jgi:uncharacterized membrane protein YkvA (DUF1232 family)
MTLTKSREDRVKRGFWPKLMSAMSRVPFAEDAAAAYYCAFDRATPLRAKGILAGALAYFIMPADVIPDFILGLGFTDDITVLAAAIAAIRMHMKPHHYDKAKAALERIRQGATPV